MVHAFEVPEILSLICEQVQLGRPDLARLLTTTRLFFNFAVPFVWRSLPDSVPIILMQLLPNADTYLKHDHDRKYAESLQPLDPQSVARFDFYASYIKRLTRHHRNRRSNTAWDILLKLVDRRPILPNLEVLEISLAMFSADTLHDPSSYLVAHLTPNLIEVDEFDVGHAGAYSSMGPQNFNVDYQVEINPTLESDLAKSLNQLRDLHALKIGRAALEPKILAVISRLPNLKSLDLNLDGMTSRGHPEVFFPHDSFLALQHLGMKLNSIGESENANTVWNIATVAQHITSVSVHMTSSFYAQPNFCGLARAICRYIPCLTSLILGCTDDSSFTPTLIDILEQLPLRRLCIQRESSQYKERWPSEHFSLAFQNLECLTITGYDFTFTDLTYVAKHMPWLRQLSAWVQTNSDWPSKDKLASLVFTSSPSRLCLYLGIVDFIKGIAHSKPHDEAGTHQKLEAIAATLHALWPKGLICEAYELPDTGVPNYVEKINVVLKRLRKVDGRGNEAEFILQDYARRRSPYWFKDI